MADETLGHGYILVSPEFLADALRLPPSWTITDAHKDPNIYSGAFVLSISAPGLPPTTDPRRSIDITWHKERHNHVRWEREAPDRWQAFINEFCPDCV